MRPGDMDQWEVENDRVWRGMLRVGVGLVLMLFASMLIGIVLGYLICGI